MKVTIAGKSLWLNYHHLYYFYVIAMSGTIAQASQRLKLGQPTLSAQLKQFEDSIGTLLFERKNKRLFLTETGKVVLDYANQIFQLGNEMLEVVQDRRIPNRVHVQVGVLDSIPKHVVLELVKSAFEIGNCTISILEGKGDEMIRELVTHRIDLFVSNFVPSNNEVENLYAKKITRAPVVICANPKYKHLKKGFPGSLNQKPFVVPTFHSRLRHDVEHFFKLNNISLDIIAETQDLAILKLLGIEGLGLVPAPLPAVEDYIKSGDLVQLGEVKGVFEEIYLIAATRKLENPISSQLMKQFEL